MKEPAQQTWGVIVVGGVNVVQMAQMLAKTSIPHPPRYEIGRCTYLP